LWKCAPKAGGHEITARKLAPIRWSERCRRGLISARGRVSVAPAGPLPSEQGWRPDG
jgi:hypothetical protein